MDAPADRRKSPRIDVSDGRLVVTDVDIRGDLRLHDLGSGGFLISGPVPYAVGEVRTFCFVTARTAIELKARVVHSQPRRTREAAAPVYLTGLAFLDVDRGHIARRIDALLEQATAVLSFAS